MLDSEFDLKRQELGHFFRSYLESQGIQIDSSNKFSCISGTHQDSNPSMRVMRPHCSSAWCYSCNFSCDIFTAANKLEGKPLTGHGFIEDNLNYLCDKFALPRLQYTLTEEDERTLLCERIHNTAGIIFRKRATFEHAKARGWNNEEALRELGIGTINDRDGFYADITKALDITVQDLENNGLDRWFFGPDKLTFVLADRTGATIGFSARDLEYENKKTNGIKAQKYVNPSHERNIVYRKNSFVYNLNRAKKGAKLIVLEGYADVTTCECNNIYGSIAIGSTAFTEDQIKAIIRSGHKEAILCLDYDFAKGRAGQDGTLKAIALLRGFPDLRVKILNWESIRKTLQENDKQATEFDVDYIITKHGAEYFNKLLEQSITPIEFFIGEQKARGLNNNDIAAEAIKIIAISQSALDIENQVTILADGTGIDRDLILEEVKLERARRDRQTIEWIEKEYFDAQRKFNKSQTIKEKIDVIQHLASSIGLYDSDTINFSQEEELNYLEQTELKADGKGPNVGYVPCGIQAIDDDLGGGIPLDGKLLGIAGRPHVGKTQMQQRMVANILDNSDTTTLIWTLDDDKQSWYQKLWSAVSKLEIYKCMRPNAYIKDSISREKFEKAKAKVRQWVNTGRLLIRDGYGGNSIDILEGMVKSTCSKTSKVVCFFDNLHKTAGSSDRSNIEHASEITKNLTQRYRLPIVMNLELRKRDSNEVSNPREPSEDELKETGKIHYDLDWLMMLDSPMIRLSKKPDSSDAKGKPLKSYRDYPNTFWQPNESMQDMPVLWGWRKKNKIFNISGEIEKKLYFKFDHRRIEFSPFNPSADKVIDYESE